MDTGRSWSDVEDDVGTALEYPPLGLLEDRKGRRIMGP